jgi:hypothetical protein
MDRDEKIKYQLNRTEKLSGVVNKNKSNLEHSLSNLDEYMNKSSRTLSPGLNRSHKK